MSESFKEQHPLLCEDISEEELHRFSPHQRRHMGYRGRARNNIKGAAAIIKNWPDHWTSPVTFCWIGFGMLAVTVFIIYNSVIYAMLSTAYTKPMSQQNNVNVTEQQFQKMSLPDVFMHVVINSDIEADLNKYLPYIEIISNKYLHYTFKLIVLFNDTRQDEKSNYQAELNNEDALNSLWTVNNINDLVIAQSKKKSNLKIQYMNLSSYFNSSPLQEHWKHVPYKFVEFFLRAVSIWDKGGIVLNPVILTPRSPHAIYIEKLQHLLQTYQQVPKLNVTQNIEEKFRDFEQKKKKRGHKRKSLKRVDNIQDIIDALDAETVSQSQPVALSEAENEQVLTKVEFKPFVKKLIIIRNSDNINLTDTKSNYEKSGHEEIKSIFVDADNLTQKNVTGKPNFLPLFLDFLFHDKSKVGMHETTTRHASKRSIQTESAYKKLENEIFIQPMIIPAPSVFDKSMTTETEDKVPGYDEDADNLTIDIKGNLLSTRTPCHAFLGSIFSHVKLCTDEKLLKNFIITELSLFCNGLLSTCKGIDVILV